MRHPGPESWSRVFFMVDFLGILSLFVRIKSDSCFWLVYGRSEKFIGVQEKMWSLNRIYGRLEKNMVVQQNR